MAQAQGQNPLGIVGHKKAVPSADDLLSIRLLSENDAEFSYLKKEATLYLKSALAMLNNSPFLRSKFGGDGIPQASVLAELLKQRADTLNFQLHVDDMSRQLLAREMRKTNMTGMAPISLPMFKHNGASYAYPANILGLRQTLNADNGQERLNMWKAGTKNLDAWGKLSQGNPLLFNDDADVTTANNNDSVDIRQIMGRGFQ